MRAIASSLTLCIVIASASVAGDQIGPAIRDVPIFDAHMHYKIDAWDPYPVETVIELMDKSGVSMALVSSTPDEGTIKLWEYAPRRIVPEMRPYFGEAGSANWTKSEGRLWLARLPRDVAERIAYKNAEKLFKRKVSNDLLGAK